MKMAERIKHNISRVITSFQLCRSKDPSTLVASTLVTRNQSPFKPKNSNVVDVNISYSEVLSPPLSPNRPKKLLCLNSFAKRNGFVYLDLNSEDFSYDSLDFANKQDLMTWAAAKAAFREDKKKNKKKGKASVLWSEVDEYDQETEILLLSGSFRSDTSCEFSQSMDSSTSEGSDDNNNNDNNNDNEDMKMRRKLRCHISRSWSRISLPRKKAGGSPEIRPEGSVLKRLMPCKEDGKVKESVAVVKKSEDPYEDFRRSMLEMVLEREMFEPNDLEELLQCFLSLNSSQYHGVIVEAFSELWEVLFGGSPGEKGNSSRRFF